MPDSAQMDPQILDQKRKRQRQRAKKPKQPTTVIPVDAANLKHYAEYFTGLHTGLHAQRMISHMQNQQSQLYPNQNSNATGFVHHPSTNEGPSSFDHNQHLLQNISQDIHHLTHSPNFGNQGGIGLDHNLNFHNFGHSIQHSQPWMEGHNSNINLSLGTQSYLGNIHSVQETPNNLLPNFQPHYQSGITFGNMNDNTQINSAFIPYKSQISQQMSRNHQNVSNSETSNTSMNRNSGKMLAGEEEVYWLI
uniref:Uncharacterized protein n=1 Tax=Meloidogyne enterolobii TaxID=390850 RepID=A0A6V7V4M3_MELEN|nr:unnamed protein product [Meloidogyne enterolobii]